LEEKIKAFNSQLIHSGGASVEKILNDQRKMIKEYENKIRHLEEGQGRNGSSSEFTRELFEKQSQILNSLTNKLNERDEVNQHLNE
jgi:hypothetical protein